MRVGLGRWWGRCDVGCDFGPVGMCDVGCDLGEDGGDMIPGMTSQHSQH
jgi:hypothetical protein